MSRTLRRRVLTGGLVLGLATALVAGSAPVVGAESSAGPSAGLSHEWLEIGTSVRGRPIKVLHRSRAGAQTRVVVIGNIHGDEKAGLRVVKRLRHRTTLPKDLDLYLIRTANPDGVAADRRTNAHGVDLNRNFPYRWHPTPRTTTWSGKAPLSEPETVALRAFIRRLHPDLVVTFHQPLFGVGANDKAMPVVRRLAAGMRLPVQEFHCTGVCNGSFTSWVNHRTDGLAVTVEFGHHVATWRVRAAARTVLSVGASLASPHNG